MTTEHPRNRAAANNPARKNMTDINDRLSSVLTNEVISELRELGERLLSARHIAGDALILSFGAHAPDYDCDEGSVSVTVQVGSEAATAHANGGDIATALLLAHGKALRQAEAARKKRRRDTDGSPEGQDAERLDGEAATAGAEGIAQVSEQSS